MAGPRFSGTAGGALAGGHARLCGAFVVMDDSGTMALAEEGGGRRRWSHLTGKQCFLGGGQSKGFHGAVCLRREFMKTESGRSEFTWRSDETQGGS